MPTVEELITHACHLSPQERQRLMAAVAASLRSATESAPEQLLPTREAFRRRYQMAIDADLWDLVGSQPVTPVEEDKALIREAIERRLSA